MTARISSSTEDTTTNPFYKYMNEQEMELYQIIMEYILRKKTNDVERNTRQWSPNYFWTWKVPILQNVAKCTSSTI